MIRFAVEEDTAQLLDIYAPYILTTTATFEYTVPTLEEFTRRFREITAQFPWLVWEENGVLLGYAYGSAPFTRDAYRWCAEDSVYLRPEARRRGIGKALLSALEEILRAQGYRQVLAIITSENTGSLAFHETMGYAFRGELKDIGWKFDRWLGVVWMEKELQMVESPRDFPKCWQDVVKNKQNIPDILDKMSISLREKM